MSGLTTRTNQELEVTDEAIHLVRDSMNALRGQLFQFVESIGLPERQELAMKGLIRHLTYAQQTNLERVLRGQD